MIFSIGYIHAVVEGRKLIEPHLHCHEENHDDLCGFDVRQLDWPGISRAAAASSWPRSGSST